MDNLTSTNQTICLTDMHTLEKLSSNGNIVTLLSVLAILLVMFTLLLNLTLIVALCRYTKPCLNDNNITKKLMTSLAVVDVLMTVIEAPCGILLLIYNGEWILGLAAFKGWQIYSIVLSAVSACHIFSMALDKYLAICQPTKYRVLPDKTGYIMIIISWFLPIVCLTIIFCLPGLGVGNSEYDNCFDGDVIKYISHTFYDVNFFASSVIVVTSLLVTYILYGCIFIQIKQWSKRTKKYLQPESSYKPSPIQSNMLAQTLYVIGQKVMVLNFSKSPSCNIQSNVNSGRRNRSLRAIRTIASIVLSFTVSWCPVLILSQLILYKVTVSIRFYVFVNWMSYINSTMNPLLCTGVKFVRASIRNLLST
ncbi:beta-3 adrenergic receptor [Biomphalaria glabrata]|nr:beta-3 adrenergic receptor-like [Biomphalaria glabrata]